MRLIAFVSPFYEDVALNELAALCGARLVARLAPGTLLLESALSAEALDRRLAGAPPVFCRQLIVDIQQMPLGGDPDVNARAPARAWEEVAGSSGTPPGRIVVCDAEGRGASIPAVEQRLRALLPRAGAERGQGGSGTPALLHAPDDRVPDDHPATALASVLGVVLAGGTAYVGRVQCGAGLVGGRHAPGGHGGDGDGSPPCPPGGRPDLPFVEDLISRSALKLLEAIETFAIRLAPGMRALDLGASPGGWTQLLARRGLRVDAVDPGALDPRAAGLPGVREHRMTAQTFLRAGTSARVFGRYDLLVNDMRLDARESARIMAAAGAVLGPGGTGLITLKLPQAGPTAILRQAQEILRGAFAGQQGRCLFYNRNEVTVLLRR